MRRDTRKEWVNIDPYDPLWKLWEPPPPPPPTWLDRFWEALPRGDCARDYCFGRGAPIIMGPLSNLFMMWWYPPTLLGWIRAFFITFKTTVKDHVND